MIKKIIKILLIITLIFIFFIFYLSIFGIKTTKFNNQIKSKISENNKRINLDLKTIKISLSPLDLKVNISTLEPRILFDNKKIELESLKTKISLLELFKNQFSINNLQITSRSIKAKNLVSLLRSLKNDSKLFFLEMMIKEGYLEGSIDLNFDKEGNVKNDFKINGIVKELKIRKLKNYNLDNLNFIFKIEDKKYKFLEIDTLFNKIRLNSPSITIEEKNNLFFISGRMLNKEKDVPFDKIKDLLTNYYNDSNLKDLQFVSDNNFSFEINKGELLGIMGHNGAGKSTLINVLCGLVSRDQGNARISDKNINDDLAQIRKQMGVVSQFDVLWDELTGVEHMYLFQTLKRVDVANFDKLV